MKEYDQNMFFFKNKIIKVAFSVEFVMRVFTKSIFFLKICTISLMGLAVLSEKFF